MGHKNGFCVWVSGEILLGLDSSFIISNGYCLYEYFSFTVLIKATTGKPSDWTAGLRR